MRVFDYIIVCKSPDFKNVDRMSQFMLFVSIVSFVYSAIKGIYPHPALIIAISASVLSWWIFCVFQRKRGVLPYYRLGLLFASWGWYLQPNGLIIAGIFLIAALFERQVKFPSEIAFDEAGVVLNTFPKKYIAWADLQNVLIKDNVLTIDFKNNKLIQKDINEPVSVSIETEFNAFCAEQFVKIVPLHMSIQESPFILYSDGEGNIFEDTSLYVAGRAGWDAFPVPVKDWIELPNGGNLYELPGRRGIGIDVETGEMRICDKGWAVAAFIPPAHTGLYVAAYETSEDAPTLPLFCYTAVGWLDGKNYVPAVRIEQDIRQDCEGYDQEIIDAGTENLLKAFNQNRLVKHLMDNCCQTYDCPAARNFAMGRWECPIPISPACNANCIGCISFQPQEEEIISTQDRLTFKPTAAEVVEYTVPHLMNAPFPIVSFGQGCEGEPLLMWETIKEAIIEIRKHTDKGSININTNGSNPKAVAELAKVGLDSIRVSLNSARENIYTAYYRPNNYQFSDIIESLKVMSAAGKWTSINYFVFPGMTDCEEEYEALRKLIIDTDLKMIQWRNFNIDPDWYLGKINVIETGELMGIKQMMDLIREEFPDLKFGYFNPPMERIKGDFNQNFAHH